jgi:uncharacterized protein YraI
MFGTSPEAVGSPNRTIKGEGNMTLKIKLLSAASVLLLSAGAASAAPATVGSAVNMRSGPGTQYEVVATIPGGATVDVAGCTGSWCQVSFNGESGFANRSYLAMGGEPSAAVVTPGYAYDDAPLYAGDYYDDGYPYGPGARFLVGPRHRFHHRGTWNGNWNGGQAGTWQTRPGWNGARTGTWQGGTGSRMGNATINRTPGNVTPQVSAPAGLRSGGGAVFRGGAAASGGVHAGGGGGGGGAGVFHGGAGAVGRAQGH